MEDGDTSKAAGTDNPQPARAAGLPANVALNPTEKPPTTEPAKSSEPKIRQDDDSINESRDTSPGTSIRLVKFQLFETKAVITPIKSNLLSLAFLYSWLK